MARKDSNKVYTMKAPCKSESVAKRPLKSHECKWQARIDASEVYGARKSVKYGQLESRAISMSVARKT